jgi:hypothetical protein
VLSGHKKSFEHDLVEFGVGSSGQKSVEFDEHVQVEIIALGGFSDGLSVLLWRMSIPLFDFFFFQ